MTNPPKPEAGAGAAVVTAGTTVAPVFFVAVVPNSRREYANAVHTHGSDIGDVGPPLEACGFRPSTDSNPVTNVVTGFDFAAGGVDVLDTVDGAAAGTAVLITADAGGWLSVTGECVTEGAAAELDEPDVGDDVGDDVAELADPTAAALGATRLPVPEAVPER